MINRAPSPKLVFDIESVKRWLWEFYKWVAQILTGEFTGYLTGMTATVSGTVKYSVVGDIVTLMIETSITGTSNATSMTMTDGAGGGALPADIRPSVNRSVLARVQNNTTTYNSAHAVVGANGIITFYTDHATGAFSGSNTKGLLTCHMVYKQ